MININIPIWGLPAENIFPKNISNKILSSAIISNYSNILNNKNYNINFVHNPFEKIVQAKKDIVNKSYELSRLSYLQNNIPANSNLNENIINGISKYKNSSYNFYNIKNEDLLRKNLANYNLASINNFSEKALALKDYFKIFDISSSYDKSNYENFNKISHIENRFIKNLSPIKTASRFNKIQNNYKDLTALNSTFEKAIPMNSFSDNRINSNEQYYKNLSLTNAYSEKKFLEKEYYDFKENALINKMLNHPEQNINKKNLPNTKTSISVNLGGITQNIASENDAAYVIDKLARDLAEAILSSSEGVF